MPLDKTVTFFRILITCILVNLNFSQEVKAISSAYQVTSEGDVQQAIKLANETFGPLTTTVNCAGIGIAMRTLSKKGVHPLNQFEKVLKVNTHLFLWPLACLTSIYQRMC